MRNNSNPVRQGASRTENGNIVSVGAGARPNFEPAQVEDIHDRELPVPDPGQVFPQEAQCQASPYSAQLAGISTLTH